MIRIERRYANPIERVWRAVTEPDELARWFVASASWTPKLGEPSRRTVSAARSPSSSRPACSHADRPQPCTD